MIYLDDVYKLTQIVYGKNEIEFLVNNNLRFKLFTKKTGTQITYALDCNDKKITIGMDDDVFIVKTGKFPTLIDYYKPIGKYHSHWLRFIAIQRTNTSAKILDPDPGYLSDKLHVIFAFHHNGIKNIQRFGSDLKIDYCNKDGNDKVIIIRNIRPGYLYYINADDQDLIHYAKYFIKFRRDVIYNSSITMPLKCMASELHYNITIPWYLKPRLDDNENVVIDLSETKYQFRYKSTKIAYPDSIKIIKNRQKGMYSRLEIHMPTGDYIKIPLSTVYTKYFKFKCNLDRYMLHKDNERILTLTVDNGTRLIYHP